LVEVDVRVVKELNHLTEAPAVVAVVDLVTQIIQAQNLQVVEEQVMKAIMMAVMVVVV
jgi:chemotaxis protein CheY-P-specific phosphatase CheC